MNKKVTLLTIALALGASATFAQSNHKSFEEFRSGIKSNFNAFRKTILDNYADFLDGEWHPYKSLNGELRDRTPKPSEAPQVPGTPKALPSTPPVAPVTPPSPVTPVAPVVPAATPSPVTPPAPTTPAGDSGFAFSWYNIPTQLPAVEYHISHRLSEPADFARQWRELDGAHVADRVLPGIRNAVKELGLNDYLTYKYIESYINARFPEATSSSRMAAVHYLLANMGYDARIAVTSSGVPLLLLPCQQTMYARNYLTIGDGKYYIFAPEDYDMSRLGSERILTCNLPAEAAKAAKFDLVLGQLNIPVAEHPFDLNYGDLHLTGSVNANLIPILYKYPQMPVSDYARSNIEPQLRNDLVRQVRQQLGQMNSDDAVEALLTFMHGAFEYATDEENHGFEKPYFLEETLYYPKNDCEDRAIFYTWLVWNALGHEAQLISFPGHEAAAVHLNRPLNGASYVDDNTVYYISDPTYIGSRTGMVMPVYNGTSPRIDYTYKNDK